MRKNLKKWLAAGILMAFSFLPVQTVLATEIGSETPDPWKAWIKTLTAESYSERMTSTFEVKLGEEDDNTELKVKMNGLNHVDNSCGVGCKTAKKIDFNVDIKMPREEATTLLNVAGQFEMISDGNEAFYLKLNSATSTWSGETEEEKLSFEEMQNTFKSVKGQWLKFNANEVDALRQMGGKMKAMRLLKAEEGSEDTVVWVEEWIEALETRIDAVEEEDGKALFEDLAVLTLDTFEEQDIVTEEDRQILEDIIDVVLNTSVTRHYELKRKNGTTYFSEVMDRQKVLNLLKDLFVRLGGTWDKETEKEVKALLAPFSLVFYYDVNDAAYLDELGVNFTYKPVNTTALDTIRDLKLKTTSKLFNFNKAKVPAFPTEFLEF